VPSVRARDGTRLHYEVAGGGLDAPAVLLVMGLVFGGEVWGETRDVLAASGYRTVAFDNRGTRRSEAARGRFTTSVMAEDAVAVMRAAFVRRAHVVGVSLGGMIAQEIALRHPGRVGALVLQSTTGGSARVHHVAPALALRSAALVRARVAGREGERRERVALRVLTTRRFARRADLHDPRVRGLLDAVETGISPLGYLGQVRAVWTHRAWGRLRRIQAPTLVQHGTRDGIIRASAGRAIAARIPGAELQLFPGAGHVLAVERPESIAALHAFLRAHDDRLAAGR
jgi:pimeloyl-ACP methyl ester carboxylesterase